tara:strand:- start:14 stop:1879 length:1866 start_codon:yes stop_codon:yes gene_type:complete
MTTTYTDNGTNTPNGSHLEFSFTFPVLQNEDVKVALNGVTQATTKYSVSTSPSSKITFNNTNVDSSVQESTGAPKTGVVVRVYRQTTVQKNNGDADPKAVFAAGSSIRAGDLNNNVDQALFALAELQEREVQAENIADGAIRSVNIFDGTLVDADISGSAAIAQSKIATGNLPSGITVNSSNIVDGSIVAGDLATGTLDGRYYTETELDAGQLDNRYYTETELNAGQLDNRYFTETESDGRFLRQDSSAVIDSNATWTTGNTHVATTGAIEARVIDLIDDVGGFDAIANETSFPATNPQAQTGQTAILSVAAVSTTLTPSTNTITIANGAGTGNTVTINNVTATSIPAGFGMLVESTSTTHTYNFHRLVPKALDVNTVATNITNVVAAGANVVDINNFADKYIISSSAPTQRADGTSLQNGDLWYDSSNLVMMVYDGSAGDGFSPITPSQATIQAINSVSGYVTFTEDLGSVSDAVNTGSGNNSINTVGSNISSVTTTAGSIANVNTVAGAIANVNTTATNIANVNNVGGSIADVNRYANEYKIQGSAPSSPSGGDLWFNSTSNTLNYYTGSTWVGISPGIAGVINDANPQLANHLDCNDKNLTEVGTVSGDNLQIDFGTL